MYSITHNNKNQNIPINFLPKKLIATTVSEVDELIIYADTKSKAEKHKRQELRDLLENMKKFLLDKKADSSRKAAIILRMPLLQITVRKA